MDVDDIGTDADGGLVNDTVQQILFRQCIDAVEPAGFPNTQEGIEANQPGIFKTWQILAQHFNQLQILDVPVDGGLGQIPDIAAVDAHMPGAVEIDAPGRQGLNGNQRIPVYGQDALFLQLGKQLAEGHNDMVVGIGAVVGRVITGSHLDGRCENSLFRVLLQTLDDPGLVHTLDGAHQRGRLQLTAALLSHFEGRSGHIAHIAVTGGINKDLCLHFHFAALAEQGHGQETAVFHIGINHLRVKQDFHTGFHALFKSHDLEHFVIIDRYGVMHGAPMVGAAGIPFHQRVHQLLGDAADHLISVPVQIAQQRQTDGQVSAEIAVLFNQQHLCAMTGCGDCGGNTAGTSANHDCIIPKGFQFHMQPPVFCQFIFDDLSDRYL